MVRKKPLSMTPNAVRKREKYKKARDHASKATPSATPTQKDGSATIPTQKDADTAQAASFQINIEDAPEETFTPEEKPGLLGSVLGRLGVKPEKETPGPAVQVSATLSATQNAFCKAVTPICSSLLTMSLGWAWAQLDRDYKQLAPSKDVAVEIVAPLVRIYARHNKAMSSALGPDTADVIACLNASVMYIYSSMSILEVINQAKREAAAYGDERPANIRDYRASAPEARPNGASDRRAAFSGADYGRAEGAFTSTNTVNPGDLTEREQRNYSQLSLLRERDIAARARRSGRYG